KREEPTSKLRQDQFKLPKAEGDKEDAEVETFESSAVVKAPVRAVRSATPAPARRERMINSGGNGFRRASRRQPDVATHLHVGLTPRRSPVGFCNTPEAL